MYKMYGQYAADGRDYVITERKTPRHWYNYLYNDDYITFLSQVGFGEGFVQDNLGRRAQLVNDRMLYVRDAADGSWFSAFGLPVKEPFDEFSCTHALGSSTIHTRRMGISSDCTVFVPVTGYGEIWKVTLTNHREKAADLRLISYCDTGMDFGYRPQGYNTDIGGFDADSQAVWARGHMALGSPEVRALYQYMLTDGQVSSYDAARNAFIGVYGHTDAPEALTMGQGCTNGDCLGEKLCLALEAACILQPGESKTLHIAIGLCDSKEDLVAQRSLVASGRPEALLNEVMAKRASEIGGAVIETPDHLLNQAFNGFYQYATVMGSRWARVRHNGYRDLMSDSECLSSFNAPLAWQRFKRVLTYQYANGYAPRTFLAGAVRDNNFADCAVWITFTGYACLMELGNLTLLDETVAFNGGSKATVYEHMKRSVDYLYGFTGQHGLIKIWGGDWNDCMNEAGLKGRGESVWLSIAWCRAARMMAELAHLTGRSEDEQRFIEALAHMEQLIGQYGWDGEYYLTAIDDEGRRIGSHENEEGSLYLNPQLWAVLGEVGSPERRAQAMLATERLEMPLGAVVSAPAYTHVDHAIGSMTWKAAGMHENGGVYLHAMCWKLAVDAILGRRNKVSRDIAQILPWDQTYAPTVGEPYILYNSYFTEQTGYRYATPGQSWRTASTSWFVKAMLLYVFGLQPSLDGLHIKPCLPAAWKDCSVTKVFRGCTYHIHYTQQGEDCKVQLITADGEKVCGALPCVPGKAYKIEVVLG